MWTQILLGNGELQEHVCSRNFHRYQPCPQGTPALPPKARSLPLLNPALLNPMDWGSHANSLPVDNPFPPSPPLQSNPCSSRLHVALLVGGHKEVVSDPLPLRLSYLTISGPERGTKGQHHCSEEYLHISCTGGFIYRTPEVL